MVETAEEDEDGGDRVRRAAVRAGSLRIVLSVKPGGVASAYVVFDVPTICSGWLRAPVGRH
jgi:hypothetical protein